MNGLEFVKQQSEQQDAIENLSNQSFIINGDFQVWSKGKSFSIKHNTSDLLGTETADKWRCDISNGATTNVASSKNCMSINTIQNESFWLAQFIELNDSLIENLSNKDMTLSFDVKGTSPFNAKLKILNDDGLEGVDVSLHEKTYQITTGTTQIVSSFKMPSLINLKNIRIVVYRIDDDIKAQVPHNETVMITNIKLELGKRNTAFTPKLATETALLCVGDVSGSIGELETLLTKDKASVTKAINEIVGNIGTLANLSTSAKGGIVLAINELVANIGGLSTLTTSNKTTITKAINELVGAIGALSGLSTTSKTTIVSAINELVNKLGDPAQLTTTTKANTIAAINEILTKVGPITSLTTSNKGNIVSAVNETVSNAGALSSLNTSAKSTLVAAINELSATAGTLNSLNTSNKGNLVAAINELVSSISSKANTNTPTFTGIAKATDNGSYTTPQLRNIYFTTTNLEDGVSPLANGSICIVYES